MSYSSTAALIGSALALLILWLIRRDRLYVRDAFFWLFVAICSILFALSPRSIDTLGAWAGVAYPPALILGLLVAVLLIKALLADLAQTALRRDLRRLAQDVAIARMEDSALTSRHANNQDATLLSDQKISPAATSSRDGDTSAIGYKNLNDDTV